VQIAFVAILIVALFVAVVSFTVIGLRHSAHTKALAGYAHERGMLFSHEDPFEIPLRYAQFEIISCGHSPRAYNVMYGQLGHWPGRAFTFRYEVGHGTRRMSRRYGVVVLELGQNLPDVLMWSRADEQQAPLDIRMGQESCGDWTFLGNGDLAKTLAHYAESLARRGLNIQVRSHSLMLAMPAEGSEKWDYADWLDEALAIADAVTGQGKTASDKSP
jgi:hypothetical protein